MEVIEFRGKHTHILGTNEKLDGKWVYGYLVDRHYINSRELEGEMLVDCETVGQFTGIYDSKGNKIYKGDILEITGNHKPGKYIVVWDKYRVAWWGKNIKYDKREREHDDDWFQLLGSIFQSLVREVIGNGIDNPELLEV